MDVGGRLVEAGYSCSECNLVYSSAEELAHHEQTHRNFKAKVLETPFEDTLAQDISQFLETQLEDNEKEETKSPVKLLKCAHCCFEFSSVDFKNH